MKNLSFVLRLSLTLLAITSVVALVLAGVNGITAPLIQAHQQQKIQQAMEQVLPGAENLQELSFEDATNTVEKLWKGDIGYVVQVAPNGFGGAFVMMVGVNNDGTVAGISVVSHSETKGLGSVMAENTAVGQAFRDQFVGLDGELAADKDGGQIDAITGATISTRAVVSGVNAALQCIKNLG